jgi:hypothetical protein
LLDPAQDNVPTLWDQFLVEFQDQYQDTQLAKCACNNLENLKLKMPEIDQYILKFEDLCQKAGYVLSSLEVTHLFLKGLPHSILEETIKGPSDYIAIKQ